LVPSEDAKLLFKLFPDRTKLTVNELKEKLQGGMSDNRIRDALAELVANGCLKREIEPGKAHALSYQRHPNFGMFSSYYQDELET
jgi:predicted transcriptional regulator